MKPEPDDPRPRTLLIMRHGEAEEPSFHVEDHERSLTPRGERAAEAMGRALVAAGQWPDAVHVSDARRALQTLAALERGAGRPVTRHVCPHFYVAGVEDVLAEVAAVPAHVGTVMVLGHNPTWSTLVTYLTGDACRLSPADCQALAKEAVDWTAAVYGGRAWQRLGAYEAVRLLASPGPAMRHAP